MTGPLVVDPTMVVAVILAGPCPRAIDLVETHQSAIDHPAGLLCAWCELAESVLAWALVTPGSRGVHLTVVGSADV